MTEPENTSASLLAALREDIIERRIRSGFSRLKTHLPFLEAFDPACRNGAQLIWRVAQWVDVGFGDAALPQKLLSRIPHAQRCQLSVADYAAIRTAEGLVAMSLEDPDQAIRHLNIALDFEADLGDRELLAIANFWKARCHRSKGEYDGALTHTVRAYSLAFECGYLKMAAVMRVLESWLYFQKGKPKDSLRILAEAENVLRDTDDAVVLGNIQSTYGRIYRQEGRYDRAIEHFSNAICEYRKISSDHPNLARTLANMAYVKRLVALELRRKIDTERARRRHDGPQFAASESHVAQYREQFIRVSDEAFAHLDEAAAIYSIHLNHHGAGTVHLNRGLLHLDNGALDLAQEAAECAFALGDEKEDAILKARARILQCMVENAKLEEGIEEDPRGHAQAALEYIRDALEFARITENRRLRARAHTWHGLTLSNEFFNDHEAAREAMNTASSFLDHGHHDTAWEDLRTLKARVVRVHSIDETLLAWSQGAVGNRTFREISEQFAEIIIPKIWEQEGCKVARVATRLSISPKKVRRALSRAGLLRQASAAE